MLVSSASLGPLSSCTSPKYPLQSTVSRDYSVKMAEDDQQQVIDEKGLLDLAWERQQTKTFTAWCNSHLRKGGPNYLIEKIDVDFRDGVRLLKLLEVISSDKLPPREKKTKMRVHKVAIINQALQYIKDKGVKLVGIGPEEICDGNKKLTLGMIWTIILRFAIQDISVEELSAKEGLLLWCQRKTHPYKNVNVQNFHTSFKDGLAFCALIHRHRPELIPYDTLKKSDDLYNLNLAFDVADKYLDIPRMLDPEDIHSTIKPDERAIMTYVSSYYHAFSSSQQAELAAKRIGQVLNVNKENQALMEEYELMASKLLEWIRATQPWMVEHEPKTTVGNGQQSLEEFRNYAHSVKPPKAEEKGRLETHFHTLQTKLRVSGRPAYVPSEGKLVTDIAAEWKALEAAEKSKQEFLQEDLIRLKKLEHLAETFDKKARSLESWANGQDEPLTSDADIEAADLAEANALLKKHEAFESDLDAHKSRLTQLSELITELDKLNYHDMDAVKSRETSSTDKLEQLAKLADDRKQRIENALETQKRLDGMRLDFAKRAAKFNTWMDSTADDLEDTFVVHTIQETEELLKEFEVFQNTTLKDGQSQYEELNKVAENMAELGSAENPYTSHTPQSMYDKWCEILQTQVPKREQLLNSEMETQRVNEALRVQFAEKANSIGSYIEAKNTEITEVSIGGQALEETVQQLQAINAELVAYQPNIDEVSDIHQNVQKAMVFENPHSNYTMEMLRAQWTQLLAAGNRSINELENQILMRDARGVTDEQLKEYRASFNHFDKDGSGMLDKNEFRACLLSLGYNLGQDVNNDPEFEKVFGKVDPNQTGYVPFEAFVSFMTEETVDKDTADQVISSFKILAGDKPYITGDDLRRELPEDQAQYCIERMTPYAGEGAPEGALDYTSFSTALYGQSEL
uniref:Alpha-actinin n=1 Tax=Halisarca dujardinii TaxID=2583056 RepID=A0A9F1UC74_HALDU|nr:alpha-actinin [Halisarca dujardinii]